MDKLLRSVETYLAAGRRDVVHDILAFLAEEMTRMHKEKQEETRGFLTWLESETGAPVEKLKNKTKLKVYHEHEAETLLAVLKSNKKTLGKDPTRRTFQEDFRTEYEKSMAVLRPLLARVAATDRLIDQIVYRLYGLSEEDIKVVEGA